MSSKFEIYLTSGNSKACKYQVLARCCQLENELHCNSTIKFNIVLDRSDESASVVWQDINP